VQGGSCDHAVGLARLSHHQHKKAMKGAALRFIFQDDGIAWRDPRNEDVLYLTLGDADAKGQIELAGARPSPIIPLSWAPLGDTGHVARQRIVVHACE